MLEEDWSIGRGFEEVSHWIGVNEKMLNRPGRGLRLERIFEEARKRTVITERDLKRYGIRLKHGKDIQEQ